MAIVESENQGWNQKYLNELFSTIDLNLIKEPDYRSPKSCKIEIK